MSPDINWFGVGLVSRRLSLHKFGALLGGEEGGGVRPHNEVAKS